MQLCLVKELFHTTVRQSHKDSEGKCNDICCRCICTVYIFSPILKTNKRDLNVLNTGFLYVQIYVHRCYVINVYYIPDGQNNYLSVKSHLNTIDILTILHSCTFSA